ncbi:MAG: hypothetical protein RIB46_06365 [Pseudomonadales bacterium]
MRLWYTAQMRGKALLLIISLASILLLQATGLHLHLGSADRGSLHGQHWHHADPDGHGHADESDVTINEIGASWSKLLACFLPLLLIYLLAATAGRSWIPVMVRSVRIRRSRWRPPLRGPPLPI